MPERWTRAVLRRRALVLACWAAVRGRRRARLHAAVRRSSPRRSPCPAPSPTVPRSCSPSTSASGRRGRSSSSSRVRRPGTACSSDGCSAGSRRPRARCRGRGRASCGQGGGILYGEIATGLDLQHAKGRTDDLRRALRRRRARTALVTGQPAIQRDLDPILASDLRRGEALALPFALLVLLAVFGLSRAVAIPFVFAACTILATLAARLRRRPVPDDDAVRDEPRRADRARARDRLLAAHRPPLPRGAAIGGATRDEAVVRTMATAGRTVVFSGFAVAIGLGAAAARPGPVHPLARPRRAARPAGLDRRRADAPAGAAAPCSARALGGRAARRRPPALGAVRAAGRPPPRARARRRDGAPARARAARAPAAADTGVVLRASRRRPSPAAALTLLRDGVGDGAVTPTHVVIDAGAPGGARHRRCGARSAAGRTRSSATPRRYIVASGQASRRTSTRAAGTRASSSSDGTSTAPGRRGASSTGSASELCPRARLPGGVRVEAGGAPAQGVDFLATRLRRLPVARARGLLASRTSCCCARSARCCCRSPRCA